jgi:hypothetical protein
MTAADIDGALPLSQAVDWPYRREDWSVALGPGQGVPDVGTVTTLVRGTRPPVSGPERIHGLASQSFG